MSKNKNGFVITLLVALGIGSAVGASAARGRAPAEPAAVVSALENLPMPALDRMVAQFAAEARATSR